ncbi:MAG TPA: hypothetical protein PKA07_11325 [Micropruina sp.]|nr:hypothetical protein [Micropruina sp.]
MVQFAPVRPTWENLTLIGTPAEDFLSGGYGNDRIRGLADGDHLHGYTGDDFIFGGDGPDEIKGGAGNDHLEGGNGKDRLWGGQGDDYVHGGAGDDKIAFHLGDTIIGGTGGDAFRINPDKDGYTEATLRMDGGDNGLFVQDFDAYHLGPITQHGDRLFFDIELDGAQDGTLHVVLADADFTGSAAAYVESFIFEV